MDVVGIDISKGDFHACLLQGSARTKKSFPNGASGFSQLRRWLQNRRCSEVHICMEATGAYWQGLANALHGWGLLVSVVNPARTKMFAGSQLRRTKTDAVDAEMIADFCATQNPDRWAPPSPKHLEIRGLLSYRDELVAQKTRLKQIIAQVHVGEELGALHLTQFATVEQSLKAIDLALRALVKSDPLLREQVATLSTIKGCGFITAVSIAAKLPLERLRSGKAAAAYVGLTPREFQSGTSVRGKPRICKTGDGDLRGDLYMPALVAMRFNPILRAFAERLQAKGKPPKVIIVAVMRKLIVLAFEVLRRVAAQRHAVPVA